MALPLGEKDSIAAERLPPRLRRGIFDEKKTIRDQFAIFARFRAVFARQVRHF